MVLKNKRKRKEGKQKINMRNYKVKLEDRQSEGERMKERRRQQEMGG